MLYYIMEKIPHQINAVYRSGGERAVPQVVSEKSFFEKFTNEYMVLGQKKTPRKAGRAMR